MMSTKSYKDRAFQQTLSLECPGVWLHGGDKVLVLEGKHNGLVGTVSVPARPPFTWNVLVFPGRNNLGSYRREQVFVLKRKYKEVF